MGSLRDDSFDNFQIDGRLFALEGSERLAMIAYPPGGLGQPRPGTAHQISMKGGDLMLSSLPNGIGTIRALVGS
jgi:hypothetical protein